jgi:hypothetical protein
MLVDWPLHVAVTRPWTFTAALARAGVGSAQFASPTTARAATILVHGQPVPPSGARGSDGYAPFLPAAPSNGTG